MRFTLLVATTGLVLASASAAATTATFADTDHTYELVTGDFSFEEARALALASMFGTENGYLATITSAEEQAFIVDAFGAEITAAGGFTYLGGTDSEIFGTQEGRWIWLDGPEAGEVFFENGPVTGVFSFFPSGQPDNSFEEDALSVFNSPGLAWNDLPLDKRTTFTANYLVEFSAPTAVIPLPATLPLFLGVFAVGGLILRRRTAA